MLQKMYSWRIVISSLKGKRVTTNIEYNLFPYEIAAVNIVYWNNEGAVALAYLITFSRISPNICTRSPMLVH